MCRSLTPSLATPGYRDEFGITIAALSTSILRLAADQHTPGKSILISTLHGPELHDLPEEEWRRFSSDLRLSSQAIATATSCDKVNTEILGNAVPHLHGHFTTRYYGDGAPGGRLIRDHNRPVLLSAGGYIERARTIGEALAQL